MDLRLPLTPSVMGTIAEIKALDGAEYEVLRRDTTVVTIVDLEDQIHTVWVSADQIREYALESKMFVGNIVTIQIAKNVAEETYYLDADGDQIAHDKTFDSFVGMINTPALSLHMKNVPQFIIDEIEKERATVAKSVTKPAPRFHASRAKVTDEAELKSRADVLLDKYNRTSNPMIKDNIKSMLKDLGFDPEVKTTPEPEVVGETPAPKAKK